jgi:ubiquinone biosynthesis accessory factor UbiK
MTPPPFVDDLAKRLRELMAQNPASDVEKNFRVVMQGAFARMELVTREEFDRQREVLAKTREKLDALEEKVAGLEKK